MLAPMATNVPPRENRDLVAGSGLGFADRGKHSLKGVPGDWELFTVSVDSA